jgi:hypothetical protein
VANGINPASGFRPGRPVSRLSRGQLSIETGGPKAACPQIERPYPGTGMPRLFNGLSLISHSRLAVIRDRFKLVGRQILSV